MEDKRQGRLAVALGQQRRPARNVQAAPAAGQPQAGLGRHDRLPAKADFAAVKAACRGAAPYCADGLAQPHLMQPAIALRLADHPQRQRLRGGLRQRRRQAGRPARPDRIRCGCARPQAPDRSGRASLPAPTSACPTPRRARASCPPRWRAPAPESAPGHCGWRRRCASGPPRNCAVRFFAFRLSPVKSMLPRTWSSRGRPGGNRVSPRNDSRPVSVVSWLWRSGTCSFRASFIGPLPSSRIGETAQAFAHRAEVGKADEILDRTVGLAVDMSAALRDGSDPE